MPNHRIDRINGDIQREMSDIIRELKDPRISTLLSVVRVEVTRDLSYATIRVSAMEGFEKTKESVVGLKSAAGYIRHELGTRLRLRQIPELRFIADDSIAYSAEISEMLGKLLPKEEQSEETAEEQDGDGEEE
ncbi:MAG: 30S ribosome-binding factor RbfA [Oscillospiraceae bacterium]|jgi:ribosome-binding factor A|nr:30S ribosome-binding factor RbfA [Oscillospiraceae bacterium]